MAPPKVLFFDAGGTLVHFDYGVLHGLCSEQGVCFPLVKMLEAEYDAKEEIDRRLRAGEVSTDADRTELYFHLVLKGVGIAESSIGELAAGVLERHRASNLWRRVVQGTAELLDRLAADGYRLAVISNADGSVERLLGSVGLASRFEAIVDSGVVGVEKPDPEIFNIACRRMNVKPCEGLFVGDIYEIDVMGARAAGMPVVMIDPLDRWGDLDAPRISSLDDLPAFIAENFGGTS